MTSVIARPQLPNELALPEPAVVIVEKGPAIDPREVKHWNRHRIPVCAHMVKQSHISGPAIPFPAAAVDAVSIIVRAAARVPIILGAIHEDAILALGFGHRGE